ncbi:MAG: histidinol dehydrogenase [Cytophagaceae bacterium]|nr:histidinol dehydrogenase [Cytophagaceae bacterium]
MKLFEYPDKSEWKEILQRPVLDSRSLDEKVSLVLKEVKMKRDEALREFTSRFDGITIHDFLVSENEILQAKQKVSKELKKAIQIAANNIEKFHIAQKEKSKVITTFSGIKCWRKSVAISKVGLYIPGGTAPLFSTILMLGIPARIAGCEEIVLCTPPDKSGNIHPAILFAADFLKIKKIYKVGGAQAIAAMAYGTESVPQVYKIFGPGNQYVTAAKQLVARDGVAIDMPAGPSEVAVFADKSCVPSFVAADLLSQAEHGNDSQVLLVTNDKKVLEKAKLELDLQLEQLPRKVFAANSLANSKAILVKNIEEGIELINEYAPEHLILQVKNYKRVADKIINAGSVFLGNYTPEAAGDYASGTNHTLPTNGYAKAFSGVSLDSFVKKITFQEISKGGIKKLGPVIETMAEAEELIAHKNAVSLRFRKK